MRYFDPPFDGSHYGLEAYRVEDENHGPWEEMAYSFGAAAAFGLIGMAEAIRSRLCDECSNPNANHMGWCFVSHRSGAT